MLLPLLFASLALPQQAARPPEARSEPATGKDIVVEGLLPPAKLPTRSSDARANAIRTRREFENSRQIARCAVKFAPGKLRIIVDGEVNSAFYRKSQRDLIFRTISCNGYGWTRTKLMALPSTSGAQGDTTAQEPGTELVPPEAKLAMGSYVDQSAAGESVLDRGALFEIALRTFVPDLTLTPEETQDPEVQRRFDLREVPRNRLRLPADAKFFGIAVCMVRLQPGLAVRLAGTEPNTSEQRLVQANLISNARSCVGNARNVRADATQFRLYILDALYRWVVAARNVSTLIPADARS